ncbi:MAG: PHB depolymerase family esterase [Sinimarinibacterium sp.]|jgi:poly(hydroxyalkanoate) depolymerase family esterase
MARPFTSLTAVLATLLIACGISDPGGDAPAGGAGAESFERYSYTDAAGTRTYKLFVPGAYDGARAWPLIVELHGCGGDADEEARWSRLNEVAVARDLLIAYPEQDTNANGSGCWNWFQPEHQARDAGEPSLIAGITRAVMAQWNVDARRVYVGGISAGGAMADVMAVTYPDLYAAAMVYAGCEYMGTSCTGGLGALPAEVSGEFAYQAMGERARVVPVLVIQGDQDPLVPYPNAELVVQQFLASDDWADDGENNGSIAREPAATWSGTKPDGRSYDVDEYTDSGDAAGCVLAQRWLIHGMGHQWSNGQSDGSPRDMLFTDPLGPDVTGVAVEFFLTHPLPEQAAGCLQTES